jgi:uncharacterized membrane protein
MARMLAEVISVEVRESFRGPLPPPKVLAEYDRVLPGLAERIVVRAEKEQKFRHDATNRQISIASTGQFLSTGVAVFGQILAFLVSLIVLGGGIYLLTQDKDVEGLGALLLGLATLTAAFITARVTQNKSADKDAGGEEEGCDEDADESDDDS